MTRFAALTYAEAKQIRQRAALVKELTEWLAYLDDDKEQFTNNQTPENLEEIRMDLESALDVCQQIRQLDGKVTP